ncbi:MAG: hypothetical protein OEY28_12770, partial [Nitrospira sp.]|nr:hypothetical protein [Nitrospira sp.]
AVCGCVILALSLLVTAGGTIQVAQDVETESDATAAIELRLIGLSRGYVLPMAGSARRIAAIEGVDRAVPLGHKRFVSRYSVKTALPPAELAGALGLRLLHSTDKVALMGVAPDERIPDQEARTAILAIISRISELRPESGNDSPFGFPGFWGEEEEVVQPKGPLFDDCENIADKMDVLGLPIGILQGRTFKPSDYHVEDDGGERFSVWVGSDQDRKQALSVESSGGWYKSIRRGRGLVVIEGTDEDESAFKAPETPDPESRYVGAVYNAGWSDRVFYWDDIRGQKFNRFEYTRNASSYSEKYDRMVLLAESEVVKRLKLAVAYRRRHPDMKVSRLPAGGGYGVISRLHEDKDWDRDWDAQIDLDNLYLSWRTDKETGNLIATSWAYHPGHPLYVSGLLDITEFGDERGEDEVKDSIDWIVRAEESTDVFEERRKFAEEVFTKAIEAIKSMDDESRANMVGGLNDAALASKLGIDFGDAPVLDPGSFIIRTQAGGDLEISAGSHSTGGRYWCLFEAATGKVLRWRK